MPTGNAAGLPEEHCMDFYRAILKIAPDDLQREHSIDLIRCDLDPIRDGVFLFRDAGAAVSSPCLFSLSGEDLKPG